jgi:hypothetical protein
VIDSPIRVAFLLGAGSSIPAGMPSTGDITESILLGKNIKNGLPFIRHTDSHYFQKHPDEPDGLRDREYVEKIIKFLAWIRPEVEHFYGSRDENRPANYEDIYFVLVQFDPIYNYEGANPAIQAFVDKIKESTRYLMKMKDQEYDAYSLAGFSREAANYIGDITYSLLRIPPKSTQHLSFLSDVYNDAEISRVDIFTLNHDRSLELFMKEKELPFNDYFEEDPSGDIRRWNTEAVEKRFNYIKLHGSVDWYPKDGSRAVPTRKLLEDRNRYFEDSFDGHRPLMLMGTVNKMIDYASDGWIDLQWMFRQKLYQTNILIVSGYGFGDGLVNSRIMNWLKGDKARKIVLIHGEPEKISFFGMSLFADESGWSGWNKIKDRGQFIFIRKWIQDVSWEEVKEAIK